MKRTHKLANVLICECELKAAYTRQQLILGLFDTRLINLIQILSVSLEELLANFHCQAAMCTVGTNGIGFLQKDLSVDKK